MNEKNIKNLNKPRRFFGGMLNGFRSKEERLKEQKHLRAYLRGDKFFSYKRDSHNQPIWYKVNEIWL